MEKKLNNKNILLNGKSKELVTSAPSISNHPMIRVKNDLGGRLPSFKPPRDLSLGGPSTSINPLKSVVNTMSASKKVFIPNVNVVRRKVQSLGASSDTTTNNKHVKPNVERNRKGARSKGNFIQTQGVFSEGLSKAQPKEYGSKRDVKPVALLEKPKLNLKKNTNKKHEDIKMKELLKDDFIDDLGVVPDFHDYPMSMPLLIKKNHQNFDSLEATFDSLQVKNEKIHPFALEDKNRNSPNIFQTFEDSSTSKLLIFEFPDELKDIAPVETPANDSKQEKGTKKNDKEESNQRLANLGEGRWGTLRILKNGHAYIALGDEKIAIETSRNIAKQNVMSVDLSTAVGRGSVINLGCVDTNFTCSSELTFT